MCLLKESKLKLTHTHTKVDGYSYNIVGSTNDFTFIGDKYHHGSLINPKWIKIHNLILEQYKDLVLIKLLRNVRIHVQFITCKGLQRFKKH